MGLYGHGIYIWHIKRNFLVSGDDCCSLVWFGLDCWWACKDTYDLTIYAHRILTIWLVACAFTLPGIYLVMLRLMVEYVGR